MSPPPSSSTDLLERTYEALGLLDGRLFDAGESPRDAGVTGEDWVTAGEWLTLAKRMGAEKVYFVGDDPVLVFVALPDGSSVVDAIDKYRDAWCLARPQCLFLATPDEIRVYGLSSPPAATEEEWTRLSPIEIVQRVGDVAEELSRFERIQVDSGKAFEGVEFSSRGQRADRQLLEDVQRASAQLEEGGLPADLAHMLIERVLLVRYLEHRGVVTTEYFQKIAAGHRQWMDIIAEQPSQVIINQRNPGFENVLQSRSFTLATFRKLAEDFNGDLFVVSKDEERMMKQSHLDRIRGMLLRATDPNQPPMFLWAYDFSIVPTSLISSMYEQFFHSAEPDDSTGTHYTPPELVQFTVNEVLTAEVLAGRPKVLDPACGSGIFLVEAYRSIVRFETLRRGRRLRTAELRALLLDRIGGIDRNPEAVRLAAFSLYLALLSYQRPQDILRAGPLPRLIATAEPGSERFVLLVGDAFDLTEDEAAQYGVDSDNSRRLRWDRESFDVVVGNPPWTEPRGADTLEQDRWVSVTGAPVGDRSPSQAFIWRCLSLLRPGGSAGLLVAAGIFANTRTKSDAFRRALLEQISLSKVVNFSDARRLFFANATSPFLLVVFTASPPERDTWLTYLTMRRSRAFANTGSVSLGRMDRRIVKQNDFYRRDYLWKTYAWGSHQDANLMSFLDGENSLDQFLGDLGTGAGCGWQNGGKPVPPYIASLRELSVKRLPEWGPIDAASFRSAPKSVAFPTTPALYSGQRIVVTRAVYDGRGPRIRLETEPYSFRHTAYGIPLPGAAEWQAKVVVGTMTSSLGRYCLFMRAGRWGAWYEEVTQAQILATPLRLRELDDPATRRVVSAVDALGAFGREPRALLVDPAEAEREATLQVELDEAVFDLFGLTGAQRDLVRDLHTNQHEIASGKPWPVMIPTRTNGTIRDLENEPSKAESLVPYLRTFLAGWNREIAPKGELAWEIHRSSSPSLLCAVFTTKVVDEAIERVEDGPEDWYGALRRIEGVVNRRVGQDLFVEGVVRAVTDRQIVIAKRDEHRLWTASAAREDIEATMLRVVEMQKSPK